MPKAPRKYVSPFDAIIKAGKKKRESPSARGYDHRWRKARRLYLNKHAYCVDCINEGRITLAVDVDHIIPHRGDKRIFWDGNCAKCGTAKAFGEPCNNCGAPSNLQPLCKAHHARKTARGE